MVLAGVAILTSRSFAGDPPSEKTFAPTALGMEVPVIISVDELDKHVGRLVAIRGNIRNAKPPRILGVEVDTPDDLRHREVEAYAIGILMKYSITEEEVRKGQEQARKTGNVIGIATLGPGTYYRLAVDLTGKSAEAREVPNGNGKSGK